MRNRQPTDNLSQVKGQIAARILATPLVPYIGYPSNEHRLLPLQRLADGDDADVHSLLNVEFKRADTSVSLYMESEGQWGNGVYDKDEAGNEYQKYDLRFEVNYPCHGSASPGVVLARLHLMQEVAMLAAELTAEFGQMDVWRLVRTPAQRAEQEAKQEANRIDNAYKDIVCSPAVRGMRVGALRPLTPEHVATIPVGDRDNVETNDGKVYSIRVAESSNEGTHVVLGMVTRTK
jgi:hypothetical protein